VTINRAPQRDAQPSFLMRAIYKKYVDDSDILIEYRGWTNTLAGG
jgi:hypothetical protein